MPANGTYLVIAANDVQGPISWQGSIDDNGNSATQNGTGNSVIPIACDDTMAFQKQTEGGFFNLVAVNDGKLVNMEFTDSPYGVISMNVVC